MNHFRRTTLISLLAMLAGCYSPGGGFMPASGRGFTYISTSMQPLTISVVDVRTQKAFFSMEIPPGQQLTFNFLPGGGDDPVNTPDRMVFAVWEAGTENGKLDNQLTCPPAAARRIDIDIRPGPIWPEPNATARLRTDQTADQPPYAAAQDGKVTTKTTDIPDN